MDHPADRFARVVVGFGIGACVTMAAVTIADASTLPNVLPTAATTAAADAATTAAILDAAGFAAVIVGPCIFVAGFLAICGDSPEEARRRWRAFRARFI